MGVPAYRLLTWHWLQIALVWAPVRGKRVAEPWLNVAPAHCVVVWHVAHSCENAAAAWFGLVVPLYLARWHDAQAIGVPLYWPFLWQPAQTAVV